MNGHTTVRHLSTRGGSPQALPTVMAASPSRTPPPLQSPPGAWRRPDTDAAPAGLAAPSTGAAAGASPLSQSLCCRPVPSAVQSSPATSPRVCWQRGTVPLALSRGGRGDEEGCRADTSLTAGGPCADTRCQAEAARCGSRAAVARATRARLAAGGDRFPAGTGQVVCCTGLGPRAERPDRGKQKK